MGKPSCELRLLALDLPKGVEYWNPNIFADKSLKLSVAHQLARCCSGGMAAGSMWYVIDQSKSHDSHRVLV